MPTCWVRFSEQLQRQVVDATCQLITHDNLDRLCAIECLAAVDPNALWFKKWMISFHGRIHSVESVGKSGLMKQLVGTFLNFFNKISKYDKDVTNARNDEEEVKVLENDDIEYLGFLHSMVILTKLCQYSGGRNLFPITFKAISPSTDQIYEQLETDQVLSRVGDQGIILSFIKGFKLSMNGFFLVMVKLLCKSKKMESRLHSFKVDLSLFVSKLLIEIADADSKSRQLLCNAEFFTEIKKPIAAIISGESISDNILLNVAETLSHIVANDDGLYYMLHSAYSSLETIASLVTRSLGNPKEQKQSLPVLEAFTYVLRQCYRTCDGLNICESFKLHEFLSPSNSWALDNILIFSGSPRGLTLLEKSGSMQPCVDYTFQRYLFILF
jgi:hypothetical protein